ncbi:MAG: head-tail connector protein [Parasphingorhabdus sp.]
MADLKMHLRVDSDDEDAAIQGYLTAAEAAVANRIQRNIIAADQSPVEGTDAIAMTGDIRAAILLLAGTLYEYRETMVENVKPSMAYESLLAPYRVWHG